MKMTLEQTKLVGLTMELELKTQEYKELCEELDRLKSSGIDPNDPILISLAEKFLENFNAINEIKQQLQILEENE